MKTRIKFLKKKQLISAGKKSLSAAFSIIVIATLSRIPVSDAGIDTDYGLDQNSNVSGHAVLAHNHEGYPNQSTASYSSLYTKHLQGELNNLAAAGYFTLPSPDCGSLLCVDGIFGTRTRNAVIAYQTARGITADGIVGTTTWTQMLNDVLQMGRYALIPSLSLRVYAFSTCQGVSNSASGPATFIPLGSSAEWSAFRTYAPSNSANISLFSTTCVSGGGSSGTGGSGSSGTSPPAYCSSVYSACCAYFPECGGSCPCSNINNCIC